MGGILVLLILGVLVIGPLVFLRWRDRLDEQALAIRAEVAYIVNRALGGESLVAVNVIPARPWRTGRVQLSVPTDYGWLLDKVSASVLSRVPPDFELVVPAEHRVRPLRGARASAPNGTVMARAA